MTLPDEVRAHCAEVADRAQLVRIESLELDVPRTPVELDDRFGFLGPSREERARFVLVADAINFGSGWHPSLSKPPGLSGSRTIAGALKRHARAHGGTWPACTLHGLTPQEVARVLGQRPDHPLMALFARALNELGGWLGDRPVDEVVDTGSAESLAATLAAELPSFADPGFYKRAQITPADLHLAGAAVFGDLDRLTIFADNLVPHVLRVEGVLRYDPDLLDTIERGELLPAGGRAETEIRACAVHACELIAARAGMAPWQLDMRLWNRGQEPRFKAVPRHRTQTTAY